MGKAMPEATGVGDWQRSQRVDYAEAAVQSYCRISSKFRRHPIRRPELIAGAYVMRTTTTSQQLAGRLGAIGLLLFAVQSYT